jgi:AcrR family transcriptional regulator
VNSTVQAGSDDEGRIPARRRLSAPERRALILDAALRMFAANGYDGTAMDEIAAAAGVSKAVVYDHVSSKRELYTLLLESIRSDLEEAVERALLSSGIDGEPRVRIAMTAFFRYVEEHPEACRLLLLELQGANVSSIGRQLEGRVATGVAATLGSDPEVFTDHPERDRQLRILAELLKSAVHGLASWWYRHPEIPRGDLVDRTVALIWPAIVQARLGAGDPADA